MTRASQFRESLRLTVSYRTNISTVRVTCRVFDGSRVVSSALVRGETTNGFDDTTESQCALRVPEFTRRPAPARQRHCVVRAHERLGQQYVHRGLTARAGQRAIGSGRSAAMTRNSAASEPSRATWKLFRWMR